MAASSSSPSSSSVTNDGFTYDVFLSFRGIDTRHGLSGSLWKTLEDKGIHTFFDKENLDEGKEITPELRRAIEESRMALVVLSPDYASSEFCLEELSHILDCIRGRGRLVWPIFYEVEPSDLRWLEKGTYKDAMDAYETKSWYNEAKSQKWKNALKQVADLSGTCTYFEQKKGGYLHEIIGKIVEKVSRQIKPFTLAVPDNLVGLELQMEAIGKLLNLGSTDICHMVEVCGIGGIGKTTLSVAVFNSIAGQFECSCFLPNVREDLEKKGMTYLQEKILSDTVGEKGIQLTSDKQGTQIMRQRLRHKKVLLLLDDVDNIEKIDAIVERPEWFGPGSRVIITTRNTGMPTRHWVKRTHEMDELNPKDALDLLRSKAFEPDRVGCDEKHISNLLDRAVTIASGLPLALVIIGSHLFKIGRKEWEYAIVQYEKVPDKDILKVLEVSFNALQEVEKSAFLDIACCYKGYKLEFLEQILLAHLGDCAKGHLRVLVEKSLIKIDDSNYVTVHDLIEKMGREIVRQESWDDPGERSRLWCTEDIVQVLQEKTGTSKIEIICLDFSTVVKWDGEAFKGTTKLRTLIVKCNCHFSTDPKYLPNTLEVFRWDEYPSVCLPVDFYPKKLVVCKLNNTPLHLQDFFTKENKFKSMRYLYLERNKYLEKIPDISGLPNLEELSFSDCYNLITMDDSVGLLGKLKVLNATRCKELKIFPSLNLASLEQLDISHCDGLESFPPMVGLLYKFKILRARNCRKLKFFPTLNLASLEELNISGCRSLESFPPVVGGLLDKLKILRVNECKKLKIFPTLNLASLEELDISYCESLESFPPVVDGLLDKLKILNAIACVKLKRFPLLKLASLENLDISYCESLESFPPVLDKLKFLEATGCKKLKSFPSLKLASLEQLDLSYCESIEIFPAMENEFVGKLKNLNVKGCKMLQHLPPLKLPSLEELNLSCCESLEDFPEILVEMENIKTLYLIETPIKELPFSFRNLCGLESLFLADCGNVQFPSSIVEVSKLTELEIDGGGWLFPKQEEVGENVSSSLKSLRLCKCNLLYESLATGLKWFFNIERLDLHKSKFTTLPQCIENCQFLWELILNDCEELQELEVIPPSIKVLFATNCKSLTLSSKSKLLNQELHEARNTFFHLPICEIPEWFDHKCMEGESFSFWFRNKVPGIVLCYVPQMLQMRKYLFYQRAKVIINGNFDSELNEKFRHLHSDVDFLRGGRELQHLILFHLQLEKIIDNLGKELLENKWIHVEVSLKVSFQKSGIHVLKEKSNMRDIRFTKPENDHNIAPSNIDSVDKRKKSNDENSDLRGEAVTCLELVKPVESLPSEMTLMTKSEPVEPEETSGSGNSAVEYSIDSVKAVASVSEILLNSDVGTVLLEKSVVLPLEAANLTGKTTEDNIYPLADENATTSTLEENQPRITSTPNMVQKTSWWSCCCWCKR